jgi:ankyrin repeat protein
MQKLRLSVFLLFGITSLALSSAQAGPLHDAVRDGDLAQVKQLIAQGADVNAKAKMGVTPLHMAASWGREQVVELLVTTSADVNAKNDVGFTPLHYAASAGHTAMAEVLIAKGANVNARDLLSTTPLHYAAGEGHTAVAEVLIAKGADLNAKAEGGLTPLSNAAFKGHKRVVELLVAKGADVGGKADDGTTPLLAVARKGHRAIADLLIAKGADVNARTIEGHTALHYAAGMGHTAVVKLLITRGADVNAINEDGETPRGAASRQRHRKVAKLLKRRGGKLSEATALDLDRGYTRVKILNGRSALLKPDGWFFKEEQVVSDTDAYFISKEEIDKSGSFSTGLSLNVVYNIDKKTKLLPSQYAQVTFSKLKNVADEVLFSSKRTQVTSKPPYVSAILFWLRIKSTKPSKEVVVSHYFYVANDQTKTLWMFIFESPAEEWDEAWKTGKIMMGNLSTPPSL